VPTSATAFAVAAPLIVLPISAEGASAAASKTMVTKPPSYRPALANSAFATKTASAGPPATKILRILDEPLPADDLQAALNRWAKQQKDLGGITVGVGFDGKVWTGESRGPAAKKATIDVGDQYPIASLTKTFRLALVLQQV